MTLVEPNEPKLARARTRLAELLPRAECAPSSRVSARAASRWRAGPRSRRWGASSCRSMELSGGTLRDGLAWVGRSLREARALLRPDGRLFLLETLGLPWARGGLDAPVRRLTLPELVAEVEAAGFVSVECVYRFRDRVVLRASRDGRPDE